MSQVYDYRFLFGSLSFFFLVRDSFCILSMEKEDCRFSTLATQTCNCGALLQLFTFFTLPAFNFWYTEIIFVPHQLLQENGIVQSGLFLLHYISCPFISVLSFFLVSKLSRIISSSYKLLNMASLEAVLACNKKISSFNLLVQWLNA